MDVSSPVISDELPSAVTARSMKLSGTLRSKFGPIMEAEPTINFAIDGSVQVTGGGMIIEISKERVDQFHNES